MEKIKHLWNSGEFWVGVLLYIALNSIPNADNAFDDGSKFLGIFHLIIFVAALVALVYEFRKLNVE